MNPATNPRIHTFEGFLGGDCEIRWTEARTEIRTVYNEIIEGEEEVLVTIPARAFAALRLATVQRRRDIVAVVRHRVVDQPVEFGGRRGARSTSGRASRR